jgi:hypothetical protein
VCGIRGLRASYCALVGALAGCGGSTQGLDAGKHEGSGAFVADGASGSSTTEDGSADPDADSGGAVVPHATLCPNDPPCTSGPCAPVILGDTAQASLAIAVGGGRVYWAYNGSAVYAPTGSVGYLDRCGAGGATIATQQKDPYNVAADENGSCWTNLGETIGGSYQNDGETWCWDGTSASVVASGQKEPWGVAVEGSMVFWANGGDHAAPGQAFSADRVTGSIGAASTASLSPYPPIAADARSVYVAATNGLLAIDQSTGVVTVLVPGNHWRVSAFALDDVNLYYQGGDVDSGSSLSAVPKTGGIATVLTTDCSGQGSQIAADGRYVYCVTSTGIERVPRGGGATENMPVNARNGGLAADAVYVYLGIGGTIQRVQWP